MIMVILFLLLVFYYWYYYFLFYIYKQHVPKSHPHLKIGIQNTTQYFLAFNEGIYLPPIVATFICSHEQSTYNTNKLNYQTLLF